MGQRTGGRPLRVVDREPFNAEATGRGLRPALTPTPEFFVRSHFPLPERPPRSWRLQVQGEVVRPGAWTVADLTGLPQHRVTAVLECAGNGRSAFRRTAPGELRWGDRAVGNAEWEGPRLSDFLREVGARRTAREVFFHGADGRSGTPRSFDRSLGLDVVRRSPDILLALRMNGAPLSPNHGRPVRLVVPGWYGMAWVKWLATIELRRTHYSGPFQGAKYVYRPVPSTTGAPRPVTRMRVKSLVTSHDDGDRIRAGRGLRISGKAWSGAGRIRRVEVAVDGVWRSATIAPCRHRFGWVEWTLDWTPPRPGRYTVRARATDSRGARQPDRSIDNTYQYGSNGVRAIILRAG